LEAARTGSPSSCDGTAGPCGIGTATWSSAARRSPTSPVWSAPSSGSGKPSGNLAIDRDITQQKRAEQATIEAWRFAESITNTIQESLLVLDQDLKVVSANQAFYKTFQVAPQETERILLAIVDIPVRKEQEKKIQEHQRQLAALTEGLLLTEEWERCRLAVMLHDAIHETRNLTFELSPTTLHTFGLEAAVERTVDKHYQTRGGFPRIHSYGPA
jgi:PAS domain-containing protein